MAVSTMTAPEVEPRQRLTKWLIGAASVVMLAVGRLEDATKTLREAQSDGDVEADVAQIQQMWEDRFRRSSHSPQAEKVA